MKPPRGCSMPQRQRARAITQSSCCPAGAVRRVPPNAVRWYSNTSNSRNVGSWGTSVNVAPGEHLEPLDLLLPRDAVEALAMNGGLRVQPPHPHGRVVPVAG
jgi:hypothetical protein